MLNVTDQCRQLDEDLATTFRRSDIRLLRRVWFLEAPDQHLPYRQELEARERQGESRLCSIQKRRLRFSNAATAASAL